ncbi:MAG: dienelactone hydrolase, partial [Cyclobacteriaceae bacterium]|nr:dienelactone hydrolase [Cyclobacteriaceae bacterium]
MENIKIIHFDVKNGLNDKQIIADARLIPNGQGKPLVLFVHGFKGFKDWGFWDIVANMFAEAGFIFIKINLSHNGTTKDHPLDFADLEA